MDPDRAGRAAPTCRTVAAVVAVLGSVLATGPAQGQQSVGGVVVDASNNQPLAGAQVLIQETDQGTITGANGRFLIPNVQGASVTLEVVLIGYRQHTESVRPGNVAIRVALEPRALELEPIVVTGVAGEQQVRSLGNALGSINASELQEVAPAKNVSSLLSAEVPGVRVMASGGAVGQGGNIRIRGASSMSLSSEPLLYIDGVRVNNSAADSYGYSAGIDSRYAPSRINDINPDDIESIEIIKGPAAATLYGTEASNGVIQIITKKGRQGSPQVEVAVRQGAAWLPDPESLFNPTYYRCVGTSGQCTTGEIVEFNVLRANREAGFPDVFTTGHVQGYTASVSGGTETVKYYFSGDYDRDEGPVDYNWMNRLSGRANLNYTPSDKLDFAFSLGGVRSKTQQAGPQQPITTNIIWSCTFPGCEAGSGFPLAVDGPFRGFLSVTPEVFTEDLEGFEDLDRTTFSISGTHRPFDWLTHRVTFGGDFANVKQHELNRRTTRPGSFSPLGRRQIVNARTAYTNFDYSATATVSPFSSLRLATSGGLQYYEKQREIAMSLGEIFPVRQLETVTAGTVKGAEEDFLENKTIGAYLQEQLIWRDRVFITGAIRGDDNSAFGQNFDFVVYPKVQASWVVSDEAFLADSELVSALKLRGAWGKAGQQPDVFAALRSYEPSIGFAATPTLTPENLGNPDLEPEVGREFEAGFDLGILDERVGVEFTYYDQLTDNAIVQVPALPSLGFPGSQFRNVGQVANSGIEIGLRTTPIRSDNVGLDVNFTFSTNDNEVKSIGDVPLILVSATTGQYHVPGFSLGSIFHRRVVGADIIQVNGQNVATNVMCEGGELIPGTTLSAGGGAPVPCAQAPAVHWGGVLPTREGSASATLTLFNNLRLYGLVDYVAGQTLVSGDIAAVHSFFLNSRAILEREDPILLGYQSLGGGGLWQPGIIKSGFAKLRTLSANYTLPENVVGRFGAERASISLAAENLAILWRAQESSFGHRQTDPEIRNSGTNATDPGGISAYNQEGWPQLRRFVTTVRVSF